jgi:P-loop containing dynein motor region
MSKAAATVCTAATVAGTVALFMLQRDAFGSQPPLELLRQLIDQGGFYDRTELFFRYLKSLYKYTPCNALSFQHKRYAYMPNLTTTRYTSLQ